MLFSQIPGLQELKKQLVSVVEKNQVPHAMLFAGYEGSANLAMAMAFSTFLNCENRAEGESDGCGNCPGCQKALKAIHPDIHYVMPVSATRNLAAKDARSKNFLKEWRLFAIDNPYGSLEDWVSAYGGEDREALIPVDEIREIIRDMSLVSFEGSFKILLIWLPEKMRGSAANAFLKFLEEPPAKTVIILITNQEEQLLTTVTSRTQRVGVRLFTDDEIIKFLQEEHRIDKTRAGRIAHLANGSLRASVQAVEQIEDDAHGWFRDWMRICYKGDFSKMVDISENFHSLNKVSRKGIFQYGISMMRESLVNGVDGSLNRVAGEEEEFVSGFGKVLDPGKIEVIYNKLNDAIYYLERNASAKIVFLNTSIQISHELRSPVMVSKQR